jgi:hypothetical protein
MSDTPNFHTGFRAFLLRLHAALAGAVQFGLNAANEPVPLWLWVLFG